MLKTKMVISFLLALRRSSLARTNALQLRAREKDIWSGKAPRSFRKKRFVNRPRSDTRRNLVGTLVVCDNFIGPAMGGGQYANLCVTGGRRGFAKLANRRKAIRFAAQFNAAMRRQSDLVD